MTPQNKPTKHQPLSVFRKIILYFFFFLLSNSQTFSQTNYEPEPQVSAKDYSTSNSFVTSIANPDIPSTLLCSDLKIIFVLDESGSIAASNATGVVKEGVQALGNALLNSGATLQIIEFSTDSRIVNLGSTIVDNSYMNRLNSYLFSSYNGQTYAPSGATNWEDALNDVSNNPADLIVFFTDGYPTAYNDPNGGSPIFIGGSATFQAALDAAVAKANFVKSQGKHMFVVGVGDGIDLPNIKAISGNDGFGGPTNILVADYTTPPYEELAANLTAAVNAICGTTLQINKTSSNAGVCAGETVTLTTTVTNTGGDFNFDANSVVIKDVYPSGYSNIQIVSPQDATLSNGVITYNVGDMISGQSVTIIATATVNPPTLGRTFKNIVTATAFNANTVKDSVSVISGYAATDLDTSSCSAIIINGIEYTTSGNYSQTFPNASAAGCDSILLINFTKYEATSSEFSDASCSSYNLPWSEVINESGDYSHMYQTIHGCDSLVTAHITINQPASTDFDATGCDSYTLPWGTAVTTSGNYAYTYSTVNGCDSVVTANVTVNYSTSSSFNNEACGSYTLPWGTVVTSTGSYSYTYQTVNGCDSVVTGNITIYYSSTSDTTASVCNSFTWNGTIYTTSGIKTFVSQTNAGCTNTAYLNLTIRTAPIAGPINGPALVCRNKTGIVFSIDPSQNATSYTWTLPTGMTGNSTTNSITVATGSTFCGGLIKVTANNDCGSSVASIKSLTAITAIPSTPGVITGAISFCTPGVYTYSIANVAKADSYIWSVTGTGISITSGQGTTVVTVTVTDAFTTGTISVKSSNCFGVSCSAKSICISKLNAPVKPGTITGTAIGLCNKTGITYSVAAVAGAVSYNWTVPTGATITSGTGTRSIKVNYGPSFSGTGTISVTASNSCGTSPASTLQVSALLASPVCINGSISCGGSQTSVTYSISAVSGATSYTWSITGGASFIGSTTGTSVKVNFSTATSTTIVISVKANNSCGSSNTTTKTVIVNLAGKGNSMSTNNELFVNDKTIIFPNPTHDLCSVNFMTNALDKININIIDESGKIVYKTSKKYASGNQTLKINTTNYKKGVYFLSLNRNGIEETPVKLIVQ